MAEQHGKTLVPQIRFAGFTDPWEQRKLGELAFCSIENTAFPMLSKRGFRCGIPYFEVSDIE